MNTLSVVWFNEDVDKFTVPQEHSVILVDNALSETASEKLVDCHYDLMNRKVDSTFTWFGTKHSTSQMFESFFSTALSKTEVELLTIIDKPVDKDWGKNACGILMEGKCVAVGNPVVGTMKEFAGVDLDTPKDHVIAIESPWMLNLKAVRSVAKHPAAFNIISEGLNKACKDPNVNFGVFFAHIYLAFWPSLRPNSPLQKLLV